MADDADVAFLFLGETLLVPHLWPIAEALAAAEPGLAIDVWVSTSMHEALLTPWLAPSMRLRRAPGYRVTPAGDFAPRLPAKLPLLARLAPRLARTAVVVCAEQTSLWLPALLPLRTRFIDTFHGAGSMRARGHWRRRAGWRTLVSSARERDALVTMGDDPARVAVTGYVKAGFRHRTPPARLFARAAPTVLYNPHWQRHRSSWWDWGAEVVRMLARDPALNLIFAPHQRLVERAGDVRAIVAEVADLPNVHCDLSGFATVDGSYTAATDLYLGDTSSQVCEFLAQPRPCMFLNHDARPWRDDPSYAMWRCGDVVTQLADLPAALAAAPERHPAYAAEQAAFAAASLGEADGAAPGVAAAHVVAALREGARGGG